MGWGHYKDGQLCISIQAGSSHVASRELELSALYTVLPSASHASGHSRQQCCMAWVISPCLWLYLLQEVAYRVVVALPFQGDAGRFFSFSYVAFPSALISLVSGRALLKSAALWIFPCSLQLYSSAKERKWIEPRMEVAFFSMTTVNRH